MNIINIGELIGMLYVIEGSTLGGQLISKHLVNYQGITSETGGCFFGGYGENTTALWTDFIRFSADIDGDDAQCQAAKNSACQTFRYFTHILDDFSTLTNY
jgi:heme oxygenase